VKWSHGRWTLRCRVKGGREEVWPLPKEVKESINNYLRLDRKRREIVHSGGDEAPLFQPHTNYRTLDFDRPLSTRMVQKIVKKWADYSRPGAGVGAHLSAGADDVEAPRPEDRHAL